MMNKMDRFMAASSRGRVDRPPVGCWVHFGSALWDPALVAEVHLRFAADYDWDYIKVMDDYRFPTENNVDEVATADDLRVIGGADLDYVNFDKQIEVLKMVRSKCNGTPVIDTVFSPFQTAVRTLGSSVVPLFKDNPETAREVIGNIADRLVDFIRTTSGIVEGMHFSVNGASADWHGWGLSADQFADFVAPFDKAVLEAASDRVRIMHVHGYELTPKLVEDYQVEVISWSHHYTAPALGEIVGSGAWVPMGGLDEISCIYWPPSKVMEGVMAARRETNDVIILAPGCTVHSDTPPSVLRALAAAARAPLP